MDIDTANIRAYQSDRWQFPTVLQKLFPQSLELSKTEVVEKILTNKTQQLEKSRCVNYKVLSYLKYLESISQERRIREGKQFKFQYTSPHSTCPNYNSKPLTGWKESLLEWDHTNNIMFILSLVLTLIFSLQSKSFARVADLKFILIFQLDPHLSSLYTTLTALA